MPRWSTPDRGDVLRAMDRFHPIPDRPEFASSWAEWLYFNGRSADGRRALLPDVHGRARRPDRARRAAGVRLQLERDGKTTNYSAGEMVDEATGARRRSGSRHRRQPRSPRRARSTGSRSRCRARRRTLALDAAPGQSLPPATITRRARLDLRLHRAGARGTMSRQPHHRPRSRGAARRGRLSRSQLGLLEGRALAVGTGRARRSVDRLRPGVSAADVADADRIPGFLGVLSPKGAIGFSTAVSLEETGRRPRRAAASDRARARAGGRSRARRSRSIARCARR